MDSFFAVSSGAPPAAIAIIRISGAAAFDAATRMAGTLPPPRTASLRALRGGDGGLIDRALVLIFPGPDSATGEDVVELHAHGGKAVVRAIEAALEAQPGLRRAEPGEFTRRALLNGRIDLTEAEGLGDLLAAETEAQRRAAMRVAEGALRLLAEGWTDRLVVLAAQIEAQLDFADEEDVAGNVAGDPLAPIAAALTALANEMDLLLAAPPVERLRDGVRVVIAGPPNSGKSTLLNALAERDAAIVSPISGTTRDRIEVPVVREGMAFLLTDTAGLLDETQDPIERIGIARAEEAMRTADLVLWLGDDAPPSPDMICVHSRADLPGREEAPVGTAVTISAASGAGMAELWKIVSARAAALLPREDAVALNARQRSLIGICAESIGEAGRHGDPLLVAEYLRLAMAALDALAGRSDVEAMLDALFSRFCIGK